MAFWCKGKKGYCDDIGACDDNCEHVDNAGGIEVEDDDVEDVFIAQWISVDDRLPENGIDVLVYVRDGTIDTAYYSLCGYWECYTSMSNAVSHWMPLPKAPKEDEQDA